MINWNLKIKKFDVICQESFNIGNVRQAYCKTSLGFTSMEVISTMIWYCFVYFSLLVFSSILCSIFVPLVYTVLSMESNKREWIMCLMHAWASVDNWLWEIFTENVISDLTTYIILRYCNTLMAVFPSNIFRSILYITFLCLSYLSIFFWQPFSFCFPHSILSAILFVHLLSPF